jgi:glycosyltransferase involved in cell wall biosynthesis
MENGSNPLVSVVLSVYNGERFILEAVESILDQTFEILNLL